MPGDGAFGRQIQIEIAQWSEPTFAVLPDRQFQKRHHGRDDFVVATCGGAATVWGLRSTTSSLRVTSSSRISVATEIVPFGSGAATERANSSASCLVEKTCSSSPLPTPYAYQTCTTYRLQRDWLGLGSRAR